MNEAMVMSVREEESCSGSGRHDSVPASVRVLGEKVAVVLADAIIGHLKNAKNVVSASNTTSVTMSFLECKKDARVGMNHPW